MRRFGFAVKVLGKALKSNDARRPENHPHLRVSLDYLEKIFDYLEEVGIDMYRMSSELAPYLTHPDYPEFHGQLEECREKIEKLGERARKSRFRLSFHPSQFIFLSAKEERIIEASIRDLAWQAMILDWMGLDREAVVVSHVGGAYDDKNASLERWLLNYEKLPSFIKNRLVLENDDSRFSVADTSWLHRRCGIPLVFDYQHHMCFNPERIPLRKALLICLNSWKERPKIHFSCPSTHLEEGKMPRLTNHSDLIDPFEFAWFLEEVGDLDFDVMLEAKGKDLALLRLRAEREKRQFMIRQKNDLDLIRKNGIVNPLDP